MNGFVNLVTGILAEAGLPDTAIHAKQTSLPGYFRPTKEWDLVVVADNQLIASIEFKSQVGSFGNNFNNRIEEALGSATDVWAAYKNGAFKPSLRPWLGYLFLLEEHPNSTRNVKVKEPHFQVFKEFVGASYAKRYELFCERLVRERLYDSACLILSDADHGPKGHYTEPSEELSFKNFALSLAGHASAFARKMG